MNVEIVRNVWIGKPWERKLLSCGQIHDLASILAEQLIAGGSAVRAGVTAVALAPAAKMVHGPPSDKAVKQATDK